MILLIVKDRLFCLWDCFGEVGIVDHNGFIYCTGLCTVWGVCGNLIPLAVVLFQTRKDYLLSHNESKISNFCW